MSDNFIESLQKLPSDLIRVICEFLDEKTLITARAIAIIKLVEAGRSSAGAREPTATLRILKTETERALNNLSGYLKVTSSAKSNFLLMADERLLVSGANFHGELGVTGYEPVEAYRELPLKKLGVNFDEITEIIPTESCSLIMTENIILVAGRSPLVMLTIGKEFTDRFVQLDVSSLGISPAQIKQICPHDEHVIILTDFEMFLCGRNTYGQLGSSGYLHDFIRINVAETFDFNIKDIIQIVAGPSHILIRTREGIWGAGKNNKGQLGLGHFNNTARFTKISMALLDEDILANRVVDILIKKDNTVIVTTNNIFVAGENSQGMFGLGNMEPVNVFTQVNLDILGVSIEDVTKVVLGPTNMGIICKNNIFVAGYNLYNQLGAIKDKDHMMVFTFNEINLDEHKIRRKMVKDIIFGHMYTIIHCFNQLVVCGVNSKAQLGVGHMKDLTEFTNVDFKDVYSRGMERQAELYGEVKAAADTHDRELRCLQARIDSVGSIGVERERLQGEQIRNFLPGVCSQKLTGPSISPVQTDKSIDLAPIESRLNWPEGAAEEKDQLLSEPGTEPFKYRTKKNNCYL
ncbi:MAG: hypothetical protein HON32_08355 [Francisellaceae bacterium]|jgi:alpha-tubulin suppressor-like RCC1 family protein|nr:hypothetical protein [Francisellaceae bacterium]MBT6538080.1 hypothetical protein [Francisellaceae bacterium]